MVVETFVQVIHNCLGIGTRAPLIRRLIMVPGGEIMEALRVEASLPFSSPVPKGCSELLRL